MIRKPGIFAFIIALLVPLGGAHAQPAASLTILPERVELTRSDNTQPYQAQLELVVAAVTDAPIHPVQVTLRIAGETDARLILDFEADLVVTAKQPFRRKVTLPGHDPAHWVATLTLKSPAQQRVHLEQPFDVHNTDLQHAQAECQACRGEWGRYGMLGWEGCNCRTPDAGRRCTDGRDCQGRCLFESFAVVEEAKAPTCDDTGVCRASLGVRRAVGTCSEFQYLYGCHSIIRDGASRQPPSSGSWRMGQVCMD
jgi:hypothetical protein